MWWDLRSTCPQVRAHESCCAVAPVSGAEAVAGVIECGGNACDWSRLHVNQILKRRVPFIAQQRLFSLSADALLLNVFTYAISRTYPSPAAGPHQPPVKAPPRRRHRYIPVCAWPLISRPDAAPAVELGWLYYVLLRDPCSSTCCRCTPWFDVTTEAAGAVAKVMQTHAWTAPATTCANAPARADEVRVQQSGRDPDW